MPQNPYFPSGRLTLRQQIAFPQIVSPGTDSPDPRQGWFMK
ncbi:unnamed protein product [Anisakis simplex]|uniref:Uncharacterized protein n=1 Tax=Anisakis simplex TaxID=6269 RepID=A0A0M3KKS0_ANISI|nr:unnamed protein product [Anisakis simplex]